MRSPGERTRSGGLLRGVAVLAAVTLVAGCGSEPSLGPVVTGEIVSKTLTASQPTRPTMSDEIDHFEGRLASRTEDDWARKRLLSAHLLRFRAYGAEADLERAERYLRALEATSGSSRDVSSMRSAVALATHRFDEAVEAALEAHRAPGARGSFGPRFRLFDALWATGEYDRAQRLLEVSQERADFDLLVRNARILDRTGNPVAARSAMEEALDQARAYAQPPGVIAWTLVELGHFEFHTGRPHRAAQRYLEALEILPGSPAAVEGIADLAWGVDRNAEIAIRLYERAVELGGELTALLTAATIEESQGHAERATELRHRFVREATRNPQRTRMHLRPLALLLADQGGAVAADALQYAREDLAQRSTSESWDALAWASYKNGSLARAYQASLRATRWGVSEPLVQYHGGVISHAVGDQERARRLLEGALEGSSELADPRRIDEIRERLTALEGVGFST